MDDMSAQHAIACPHCGEKYAMTPEYIAKYGGRETPYSNDDTKGA